MRPNWPKLASLALKTCTRDSFQFLGVKVGRITSLPKDNPLIEHTIR